MLGSAPVLNRVFCVLRVLPCLTLKPNFHVSLCVSCPPRWDVNHPIKSRIPATSAPPSSPR